MSMGTMGMSMTQDLRVQDTKCSNVPARVKTRF